MADERRRRRVNGYPQPISSGRLPTASGSSSLENASGPSRAWPDLPQPELRRTLTQLLARIVVHPDQLVPHPPPRLLAILKPGSLVLAQEDDQSAIIPLSVEARIKRAGLENRLAIPESNRLD